MIYPLVASSLVPMKKKPWKLLGNRRIKLTIFYSYVNSPDGIYIYTIYSNLRVFCFFKETSGSSVHHPIIYIYIPIIIPFPFIISG